MISKKKNIILTCLLVAVCIIVAVIFFQTRPSAEQGQKNVAILVIHGDGSENTFSYTTDAQYLSELLTEEKLAEGTGSAYGMFITTVDGETADESKQQWWCITQNGEMLNTGADQTPISDGEQYELTLKEGY